MKTKKQIIKEKLFFQMYMLYGNTNETPFADAQMNNEYKVYLIMYKKELDLDIKRDIVQGWKKPGKEMIRKEKLDILIKYFGDEHGDIIISNIDLGEKNLYLYDLKSKLKGADND